MLELYQYEKCPYSAKVREKLSELNLDFICRNMPKNTRKREILTERGLKDQVPILVDMDKLTVIYGSEEILNYLDNYS